MDDNERTPSKAPRAILALGLFSFIIVGLNMVTSPKAPSDANKIAVSSPASDPIAPSAPTLAAPPAPPTPPYNCELTQVWKEGEQMSEVRRSLLTELARWPAPQKEIDKARCEINSKTDAQLGKEAKAAAAAAAEKAAREKIEAAQSAAAEAKRLKEEAAQAVQAAAVEAKRLKEEAARREREAREQAEQEKRDAAQAARDHVKELRDGIKDGSIHVLSATDLSAQTHKWDGQKIITTLSCFYADAGEYRCVGGRMRIDFISFEPDEAEDSIKRNCDTISKSQRRSCSVKILFTYDGFAEMDIGAGLFGGRLTVVKAQYGSGEILSK